MKRAKLIRSAIFILILLFVLGVLSRILMKKDSRHYKQQFLTSDAGYDALFFGSSHVHEGIDPMVLWDDFGIRSYNLASAGESVQITWYVLQEALLKATPQVVFIDSFKIGDGDSLDQSYSFVHESLDAFPLNKTKLEAINYAAGFLEQNRLSLISNLYAYHGRYGELEKRDFKNEYTFNKGAYIMTSIVPVEKPVLTGTAERAQLKGGLGVKAYEKILGLCREKGIKCVLLSVPMKAGRFDEEYFNALADLTKSYGGYVLEGNAAVDEIGLDFDHDFGDTESHLNLLGAKKFTSYVGEFMQRELGTADERQGPEAALWNEDSRRWSEQKSEFLGEKKEAVAYLFGIYDELYTAEVFVRDLSLIDRHYGLRFCLDTMGIKPREAGDDELGSPAYDMRIRVRRTGSEEQMTEQYFSFDKERNIFKTDE